MVTVAVEFALAPEYVPLGAPWHDGWGLDDEPRGRLERALQVAARLVPENCLGWALVSRPVSGRVDSVLVAQWAARGSENPYRRLARVEEAIARMPSPLPGAGAELVELPLGRVVFTHDFPMAGDEEHRVVTERATASVFTAGGDEILELSLLTQDLVFYDDIVLDLASILMTLRWGDAVD
jgi:hypothetical protein